MGTLKASQFNVYSEAVDGHHYIFNTLTHNLVLASSDETAAIAAGEAFDDRVEELGFVVREAYDEADHSLKLREAVKHAPDQALHITVVPGLACNFSCGYCYNGTGHQARKIADVFSRALDHIKANMVPGAPVHVTWYGGEPLLYLPRIRRFTKEVTALCDAAGSRYSCDLLTNASLLTAEAGEAIAEARTTSIQVSIDWPVEVSERHERGERPEASLAKVIENINNLPVEVEVTVRINVFPGFLPTFEQLVRMLVTGIRRPFEAYLHRIHRSNHPDHVDRSLELAIHDPSHYYREYMAAVRQLEAHGLHYYDLPQLNEHGVCMAQTRGKVVIGPFEGARKCIREVYGAGAVVDDEGKPNEIAEFYLNSEIDRDSVCRKCTYLPICGGGCVKDQLESPDDVSDRCTPWKFVLRDRLTDKLRLELEGRS